MMVRRGIVCLMMMALIAGLSAPALAQDQTGGPDMSPEFYNPPACSSDDTNGLILYQTQNADRTSPNRGIVVANAAGERQRVVGLDGYPIRVLATPYPNHAIVISGDDQGNAERAEVIDALRGFKYPLTIPADELISLTYPNPVSTGSAGSRYVVLSDARQQSAWLIDLADGVATDLMEIAERRAGVDDLTLNAAIVSPDDRFVLLWTSDSALLIPTATPEGDRLLGAGDRLANFSFLPAGTQHLVYTAAQEDGQTAVVLYDTERNTERMLAIEPGALNVTPLPNGEALVLASAETVMLLDISYLARIAYDAPGGAVGQVLIGPESRHVVYQVTVDGVSQWRDVNLRTATTTELPDLTGLAPASVEPDSRWVVFGAEQVTAANQGGLVYSALDLETGRTVQTLFTEDGTTYLPAIVSPGPGRFALMPSVTGSTQRYVVLDNRTGLVSSLISGRANAAALSPDGCQTVVARGVGAASERNYEITIVSLDRTADPITGEAGIAPVWLVAAP